LPSIDFVGVDLVDVAEVARSIDRFGSAYTDRVFTASETQYCREAATADAAAYRFAARFAAKEALFKALRWTDQPADLRAVEVVRATDGRCSIVLHGPVRAAASATGLTHFTLSMSHGAGVATAVVTAARARASQDE
jgi:holo-[acyl-carrier protein] synthase